MTVIVIGSSSGIGFGLAHSFLQEGRKVLGVSRSSPEDLIEHSNYIHLNIDITSSSCRSSFSSLLRQHLVDQSCLDIPISIIFMAGTNLVKPFSEYTHQEIESLFGLNLLSSIHVTQTLLEVLKGSLRLNFIYASSIWSSQSAPYRAIYGASKAAINSFVRHMSAEFLDESVFFYALQLGFVDTALTRRTISDPIIQSRMSRLGQSSFVGISDIYNTVKLLETTTALKGSTIDLCNSFVSL